MRVRERRGQDLVEIVVGEGINSVGDEEGEEAQRIDGEERG